MQNANWTKKKQNVIKHQKFIFIHKKGEINFPRKKKFYKEVWQYSY